MEQISLLVELFNRGDLKEVINVVNGLSTHDRALVRRELERLGVPEVLYPRNLYYNYQASEWVR